MDFSGKIALVAGGTGGLGQAISLAFLAAGARCIVTYRMPAEFQTLLAKTESNAHALTGYNADVMDAGAVEQMIAQAVQQHGRIDCFVNAVGGYAGGIRLWELEEAVLEKMLALNLRSGYVLSRAVVPIMLRQNSGSIVNVISKAALDHAAGAAAYAASKAAALAMMDSLAADLIGSGVRANSVLPSIIDTEANRKSMPGADFSKWPKAEEIARVILFLCSEEARAVHGAAVPVYGNL